MFKGLLKEKLFEKANHYKGSIYISKTLRITQILRDEIEKYNISFRTLCFFFQEEKNDKLESILKDRLNYIYLLEEDISLF